MKYVIVAKKYDGYRLIYPIVFPDSLSHVNMAVTTMVCVQKELGDGNPGSDIIVLTAGECWINSKGRWAAIHGSVSLNISADKKKDKVDADMLNLPGAFPFYT